MIKRIVKLTLREDGIEEFLAVFKESKPLIRNFPGCQHVELLRVTHQTSVFFTFSFWDDEEALQNYRRSELFVKTWRRIEALFEAKASAWTVERAGEGSP